MKHDQLMAMFKRHGFDDANDEINRVAVPVSYTLHNKVRNAKQDRLKEKLELDVSKAIVSGLRKQGHKLPKGTQFKIVSWENRRNFWYNLEHGYLVRLTSIHPEDAILAQLHG